MTLIHMGFQFIMRYMPCTSLAEPSTFLEEILSGNQRGEKSIFLGDLDLRPREKIYLTHALAVILHVCHRSEVRIDEALFEILL